MGRRVTDPTNPVPALGVPLAGGRWGPLCSVGVQTSPGLRLLRSIKRPSRQPSNSHRSLAIATDKTKQVETGGASNCDNSLPVSKETSQNEINSLTQDDMGSQGSGSGIYCQIKTVQTNPKDTRGKKTARYANGSVVTSDVVGGVCSEVTESQEPSCERRRVQSLRGEGHRSVVKTGSACTTVHATPPRPCRVMASSPSRLCGTCGRRRSQITQCTGACRRRPVAQITASQTLPNPARKQSMRAPQPLKDSFTVDAQTSAKITHVAKSSKPSQIPQLSHTIPKTQRSQSKHSLSKTREANQQPRPLSADFAQYKDSATQTTEPHNNTTEQTTPAEVTKATDKKKEDLLKIDHTEAHQHASTHNLNPQALSNITDSSSPPLPSSKPATPVLQTKNDPKQETNSEIKKDYTKKKSKLLEDHVLPCTTHMKAQCNGAPAGLFGGHVEHAPHGLEGQLLNVEENLLSNQEKIKVLLNVIQDLEKSKALSEGRSSYRTGQDINNCHTCQKTACIIYSVEHDFRQQEGRFQGVMEALEGDYDVPATATLTKTMPASSSSSRPSTKARVKKLRKKCFWWL